MQFGIPSYILTDNGPQFVTKFFTALYRFLEVKKLTLTAYHPKTNRQGEHCNHTIVARLGHYVPKHQENLDMYVQPLAYVYNNQTHLEAETSLFNIILAREPPSAVTYRRFTKTASYIPRDVQSRNTNKRLREWVALVKAAVGRRMAARQKGYKNDCDKKIRWNHLYMLAVKYTLTAQYTCRVLVQFSRIFCSKGVKQTHAT